MGVQVNFRDHPEVLDYYRRLAGNELQHNPVTGEKIGLEDFLNRMVSGGDPRYSYIYEKKSDPDVTGTDSGKAAYIKHWVQEYRVAAQRQIMSEAPWRFPAFHAEIRRASRTASIRSCRSRAKTSASKTGERRGAPRTCDRSKSRCRTIAAGQQS